MGCLHARKQEVVDLLYYLWKAYKAAPDEEFVVYIQDLKSQSDDDRATYMAEDLMVCAENKYKARLLDEENTWGKPTDEQEKIVAMTAEINSLKKERRDMADKTNKSTTREKTSSHEKRRSRRKRKTPKRRRPQISGHGRTSPQRIKTARKTTHLLSPSRARNTSGVPTTIMGWACGHFITQKTAKQAKCLKV